MRKVAAVSVDPSATVKPKVNLKTTVSVVQALKKPTGLQDIQRSVSVPTVDYELKNNKKFLKEISISNGSSIQNRISNRAPIRHLDQSFWSNDSDADTQQYDGDNLNNIDCQYACHGKIFIEKF
jgi:hypothetical protein